MSHLQKTNIVTGILLSLLITVDTLTGLSLWWYGLLFLLWISIMALGSFSLSWNFYLDAFTGKKNLKEKKVAITFDDGPNPKFTLEVLKILERYHAKATFFCIGHRIEAYPEVLKAISKNGHEIGNHSFSHDVMIDFNSTDQWLEDIKLADNSIRQVIGQKTKIFRPPFGVTTPKLAKALAITKHQVIGWNIRSYDTVIRSPERIAKNITRQIHPGAVILLHDQQPNILPVLEHLLQFLQKNDYKTLTIDELLNEQ